MNPLRVDPTRTATLRRRMRQELKRRFARIRYELRELIVTDDVFGLAREVRNESYFASCERDGSGRCTTGASKALAFAKGAGAAVLAKVKGKVAEKYVKLEKRYGPTYAKAIIAAALAGVPVPLPGASFAAAAPVVLLAELHRYARSRLTRNSSADEEPDVEAASAALIEELIAEFSLVGNERWAFETDAAKLKLFRAHLKELFGQQLTDEELWRKYSERGFLHGAGRAFEDARKRGSSESADFYAGGKDQFLRSAFGSPVGRERLEALTARTFTDIEGVADDAAVKVGRILADGLVRGASPRELADDIADALETSERRAETIARTELIRAHAEGQLTSLEALGIEEVGAQVEWTTAGDEKVCSACSALEGVVFSIAEARGKLPLHPNCRCAWVPAETPALNAFSRLVRNAFCATGEGGGVDPTCSPPVKLTDEEKGAMTDAEVKRAYEISRLADRIARKKDRTPEEQAQLDAYREEKKALRETARGRMADGAAKEFRAKQDAEEQKAADEAVEGAGITPGRVTLEQLKQVSNNMAHGSLAAVKDFKRASALDAGEVRVGGMTAPERMVQVELEGVKVRWAAGTETDMAATVRNLAVDGVHPKLWAANESMTFTTQRNSDDEFWGKTYGMENFKSAATAGSGDITVYDTALTAPLLAHECAHNLATKRWGSVYPPEWTGYGEAQKAEQPVSDYGSKSPAEDFAEAVRAYNKSPNLLDHQHFKTNYPRKYEAIKQMLGD